MKKLNLILLTSIILLTVPFLKGHAQMAINSIPGSSDDGAVTLSEIPSSSSVAVNQKAEKNFRKDYKQATGAEWYVLSDKSLMCRFFIENILHRAFYTSHGNWQYTISGYDGSKLDNGVADKIKHVYCNSRIVYVDQFDLVDGKTFYIVEIHDAGSIKKVRVNEDEMEVVQEFVKS